MTQVIHDEGDRFKAGFGFEENDCTVVTMQRAFDLTYEDAHSLLKAFGRKNKQGFELFHLLDKWLKFDISLKGKSVLSVETTYGKGYRVRQFLEEHPQGTFIVHVREHVLCVKDGVVFDTNEGSSFYKNHSIMYYYEIGQKT